MRSAKKTVWVAIFGLCLAGCAGQEPSTPQSQHTGLSSASMPAASCIPEREEDDGFSVITGNVEYTFETDTFTALSQVEPTIAQAVDTPAIDSITGAADPDWYLVLADVTYTNLLNEPQQVMLNAVKISAADQAGESMWGADQSMRYLEGGDHTGKDTFKLLLQGGESKTCRVGFLVDGAFYSQQLENGGTPVIKVNPDGLWPDNDRTRLHPVTILWEEGEL